MFPITWQQFLNTPAFIITLDGEDHRYQQSLQRATHAGFTNIGKATAINGYTTRVQSLSLMWAAHGMRVNINEYKPHTIGCMLSHLGVWKHIIDNRIHSAVVFEDDLMFHKDWGTLAEKYFLATPNDAELIYMGHHCGNAIPNVPISKVPVFCLNAYYVTLKGAMKLYEMITNYNRPQGIAIDVMLYILQKEILENGDANSDSLIWYCWNTEMFPDVDAEPHQLPGSHFKDKGLVFQQYMSRKVVE